MMLRRVFSVFASTILVVAVYGGSACSSGGETSCDRLCKCAPSACAAGKPTDTAKCTSAVASLCGDGGDGGGAGFSCDQKSPCPNDPAPAPQNIAACNDAKNGKCASQYIAYGQCMLAAQKCGADGKTDWNATLSALSTTCKSQADAFTACDPPDSGPDDGGACVSLGTSCMLGDKCCSGGFCYERDGAPSLCCQSLGGACTKASDCCDVGECQSSKCCFPMGTYTSADTNCCSGQRDSMSLCM
jgi:hypothetical protein